jgi:hypothetical protein
LLHLQIPEKLQQGRRRLVKTIGAPENVISGERIEIYRRPRKKDRKRTTGEEKTWRSSGK